MPAETISPIQGTMARIMRLDSCGVPVEGDGSLIVFRGFVQVQVSPQYEDGTVYRKRRADGANCVNRRGNDQFERDELTIDFCAIDPDAVVITTGQELITDEQVTPTGTGFWVKEGLVTARWSLEVWQADDKTCTGEDPRKAYWAWPHLAAGRLNDFNIEDDVIEWQITASTEAANTGWWTPDTVPFIPTPPEGAHRGFNITSLDLPTETAGGGAETLTQPV